MQTAHRYYGNSSTELTPVVATPTITWAPAILFNPGYFAYNAPVYDMTQPGLYVFAHYSVPGAAWNNTTQMIVVDGDAIAAVSAASWLGAFGDGDRQVVGETRTQFLDRIAAKCRTSKFSLLCGDTIEFTRERILTPAGITSRTVRFLTMDAPNNVVDGHIGVEVMHGGAWRLADVSLNRMFTDSNGVLLSAIDAVSEIAADTFEYFELAGDGYAFEPADGSFDATAYAEAHLRTPAMIRAWHRRIFQAVGIDHNGETWWMLPAGASGRASWVESLSPLYKVKDETTWNNTFYP